MDGSETVVLGRSLDAGTRVFSRPDTRAVGRLKEVEQSLQADPTLSAQEKRDRWMEAVSAAAGWNDPVEDLLLLGQDGALAQQTAQDFDSLAGFLSFLEERETESRHVALRERPLAAGAPLAVAHGTSYPIVQGPMARVSDCPEFAQAVAHAGALPFVAAAMLPGEHLEPILERTQELLENRPWGVGVLGFIGKSLRASQRKAIERHRPSFAIIAGGRPDQAQVFEQMGIETYLHIPSPGLLNLFLAQGSRMFVLEGNECGGHIGPRTCFTLWESMLKVLEDYLREHPEEGPRCRVLFAGGIHDGVSASMVARMAAPLLPLGVQIGVQLGTAYMITHEAVKAGAITSEFQAQALFCDDTAVLELGPGHLIRCAKTPFVESFAAKKKVLFDQGWSGAELQERLEETIQGRLWIASRGRMQQGPDPAAYSEVDKDEQKAHGLYMMGQLACLRSRACSLRELHEQISPGATASVASSGAEPERLTPPLSRRPRSDIAIVGMACLLPGARDLSTYWENILNKACAIREVPPERWDWRLWYDPDPRAPDKSVSKWGGFLDPVPFDPMDFGMPPNSLPSIEPLHLLTLLTVREALEDAGYKDRPFPRERTSVILGAGGGIADLGLAYAFRSFLPYLETLPGVSLSAEAITGHLDGFLPEWTEDSFAGILTNVAAGRVANRFDLGGVNCTVDAACGSSLAALNLAVRELQSGSTEMALVGGADTMQSPFAYLAFSKTQALTPTGVARCLDENADGIVISEGFGMLVLKRLEDAERDGDRVYAVIKAVAGSSDGKAKGLTAPRAEGQIRALQRAYDEAGLCPSTVQLMEAHATGTAAGDKEELQALNQLLIQAKTPPRHCAVGSVKSMIGHTKCTAGIASTIKAALALHHGILPPTIGVETPHPEIASEESPLYVSTESRPWIRREDGCPRRAGVSAMGFGGTNFHAVLEEYRPEAKQSSMGIALKHLPAELFLWNEADPKALVEALRGTEEALGRAEPPSLRDLSFTCWLRARAQGTDPRPRTRLGIVAQSDEDLRKKLSMARQVVQQGPDEPAAPHEGVYYTERPLLPEGKVVFLLPGQGAQYPDMLKDLALLFPEIRGSIERADQCLAGVFPGPISSYIYPPPAWNKQEERAQRVALMQTQVAQPAIAAASMGTFRLLASMDIHPDMLAGHSLGEITALCAAGCLEEEDLYRLCEARGRLVQEAQGSAPGAMAAVLSAPEALQEILGKHPDCWIVNYNSPSQTVLSGSTPVLNQVLREIEAQGMTTRLLPVSCAFHSPLIASAGDRLTDHLTHLALKPLEKPVFSNATAEQHPAHPAGLPERLGDHLRKPVRWVEELRAIYEAGGRVFIEVGPSTILTNLVKQILKGRPFAALSTDRNGKPAFPQLLSTIATLFAHGYAVDIGRLYQGREPRTLDLDKDSLSESKAPDACWRVDGTRSRPPSSYKGTEAGLTEPAPKAASTLQRPPPQRQASRVRKGPLHEPPLPSLQEPLREGPGGGSLRRPEDASRVMERFQGLMAKFLDTQRAVMLSYLEQGTGQSLRPASSAEADVHAVQASSASWERPSPDPAVAVSTPSVVEALGEREPREREGVPEEAPPEAGGSLEERARSRLLQLISDRTGYPQEVIGPDVDLEAELGIDSIKRVEILGELRQWLLTAGQVDLEDAMDGLSQQKTVQGILDHLSLPEEVGEAGEPVHTGEGSEQPPARAVEAEDSDVEDDLAGFETSANRYRFQPVPIPINGKPPALPIRGTVLVTEDSRGVASTLCDRLISDGQQLVRVRAAQRTVRLDKDLYEVDLSSPEDVRGMVEEIRKTSGPIGGIVHLLPLSPEDEPDAVENGLWKRRTQQEVKSLFYLIQSAASDLLSQEDGHSGCVLAVTAMGGQFASRNGSGLSYFPGQAGIEGLLKTLSLEWPEIHTRVVDFSLLLSAEQIAEQILVEMGSREGPVEIGFDGSGRVALQPVRAPLNLEGDPAIRVDRESVILITGGGRGITFEVASDLAERCKPRLILVGRTPPPGPEEEEDTRHLDAPADLKAALINRCKQQGREPRLREIEALFHHIMKERELRRNLETLAGTGAQAEYCAVDVRDDEAFSRFLDDCYERYGRIDGVVHGAGIIEDRRILDKSPDSFDNVFDTKVNSAFTLARKLRPETLRFLVFFSSVAGSFGNTGQCDYAAANEVLNKLALYLDSKWPSRVVSINWGPWETGMVTPELKRQFAKRGLALIPPKIGRKRLAQEIEYGVKGEGEVIISDIAGWSDSGRS
jgi:acyl transferase domain-containing protein/NAD(P)-dependent dehydrogenase (short-subunit alcohol dehydrogenase family)/NAD(P)H-dependent flavin oxidoreductase YrpB (nitropropane dioxygenase family)/acyl carrier protein